MKRIKYIVRKNGRQIYKANTEAAAKQEAEKIFASTMTDAVTISTEPSRIAIYDNGGKTLDRYTIVDLDTKHINRITRDIVYDAVSASETGAGVYLHIECMRGRHLGKKIEFYQLSKELQSELIREYSDN